MRRRCGQSGFSLMELLVAMAIILILISVLIGTGGYLKTRANQDLTQEMLQTLCTALEEYHSDFGKFPFNTPDTNSNGFIGDDYVVANLENDLQGAVISGTLPNYNSAKTTNPIPSASSAALFYFLDKDPSSRATVEAVPNALVTNKDASGVAIQLDKPPGSGTIIDLPRYIDPWGVSIRYVYLTGTAFPVLTSAGPDKTFDTPDDITSK